MTKNTRRTQRGEPSLSRARIVETAIALLDATGEAGLTFRALADALATGAGAIYFHVTDKGDLLQAACDVIVAQAMAASTAAGTPQQRLRGIGLALFDALDAHPWAGAELARMPGTLPTVRIIDGIGRQVQALAVPDELLWRATSSLFSYIVGTAVQNAANAQIGRARGLDRQVFLDRLAAEWAQLDSEKFPFVRAMAGSFRLHDDRADFLAGIDLILDGMDAQRLH